MDGTFVKEIKEGIQAPQVVEVDGQSVLMAPATWKEVTPASPPAPAALPAHTLTGLRDYVAANVDRLVLSDVMVHVVGPGLVNVIGGMEDESTDYRRQGQLSAAAPKLEFPFGQYLDSETFIIGLQTQFEQTPERDALLAFIGSVKESEVREDTDDGVGQKVSVVRGVAFIGTQSAPNPVTLKPFRTFREVDQPESKFVLRLRSNPEGGKPLAALIEADGGQWRLKAIENIAAWLRENVKAVAVVA